MPTHAAKSDLIRASLDPTMEEAEMDMQEAEIV
jgi:hypothetical protein